MTPLREQFCTVGDVELCYETFGDAGDPAVLLVMGLGTQMIGWPEDFCRMLAERGFHVIRYDNRDCGHSTSFDGTPPPSVLELVTGRPRRVAYTLADMAGDGTGLLDHLGIGSAHVVGASMGGMIAQVLAARHPRRVLSLVSLMSTTGGRRVGQPALAVRRLFLQRPARGREEYVERLVRVFRIVGSPGFARDEEELRQMAELSFDRGASVAGTGRQLAAIFASGNRTDELRRIVAPTLVIHGAQDRLVSPSGGRATARAIPGARLTMIEGMGHDLPSGVWPMIVDGIAENAARAPSPRAAGSRG